MDINENKSDMITHNFFRPKYIEAAESDQISVKLSSKKWKKRSTDADEYSARIIPKSQKQNNPGLLPETDSLHEGPKTSIAENISDIDEVNCKNLSKKKHKKSKRSKKSHDEKS